MYNFVLSPHIAGLVIYVKGVSCNGDFVLISYTIESKKGRFLMKTYDAWGNSEPTACVWRTSTPQGLKGTTFRLSSEYTYM